MLAVQIKQTCLATYYEGRHYASFAKVIFGLLLWKRLFFWSHTTAKLNSLHTQSLLCTSCVLWEICVGWDCKLTNTMYTEHTNKEQTVTFHTTWLHFTLRSYIGVTNSEIIPTITIVWQVAHFHYALFISSSLNFVSHLYICMIHFCFYWSTCVLMCQWCMQVACEN